MLSRVYRMGVKEQEELRASAARKAAFAPLCQAALMRGLRKRKAKARQKQKEQVKEKSHD